MWVPLSFGNAEIPNHHPKHFYPGGAYVDWVGTTWYSRYSASSACTGHLQLPAWRRKPFAFAEWGVWGADVPSFVRQFFGFLMCPVRRCGWRSTTSPPLSSPSFGSRTTPPAAPRCAAR